ncbi:hypothetical protein [Spirosoma fluviale]|uniref:Uncharacterized protein n=1 Tax=Spirosoma fluviale TaxID=1597977 RepID=A0A286FCH4_9BACT|nr:hypothetical protein [Spirosoma fluviale]SOD80947.1 hypothetical protein SAMN06269250_1621 [Spirosoma fluviale]
MNKNSKQYNYSYWLVGAAVIAILIPIIAVIIYRFQFGTHKSEKTEVWGQFGDFLNVFISIANLVIFGVLTFVIHKSERHRDTEKDILESAKTRPILIFKDIGGKWICKNVGEGTAINAMIAYKGGTSVNWENPVKVYSLMSGEPFEIDWRISVYQWRAKYYDVHGNVYTSTCTSDETLFEFDINGLYEVEGEALRLEDVKGKSYD